MTRTDQKRILIGITGASGSVIAERLIEFLVNKVPRVYILLTDAGRQVVDHELSPNNERFSLIRHLRGDYSGNKELSKVIRVLNNKDFFSPVASGSGCPSDMIIAPCSMGTMSRIKNGLSSNLLERAADVVIKERKNLVFCPRETPLSPIHLENLLALSKLGCRIVPPVPAFYQSPKTMDDLIDFSVGKLLEAIEVDHKLYPPWNPRMR